MFHVGEVARKLNLNPQTLYFYERIHLIPLPQRTEAGYRLYSEQDLERLTFIVRAKSLGLNLNEIKDILALRDGQALTCQAVYESLERKVQAIQKKIDELEALRDELLPLLERCQTNLARVEPTYQCTVLDASPDLTRTFEEPS